MWIAVEPLVVDATCVVCHEEIPAGEPAVQMDGVKHPRHLWPRPAVIG